MKPRSQFEDRRFPKIDSFFQVYSGRWHGWGNEEPFPSRHNLGRDYLVEAARERAKEMVILAVLLLAAAWPTVLVMIEIARLHQSHH